MIAAVLLLMQAGGAYNPGAPANSLQERHEAAIQTQIFSRCVVAKYRTDVLKFLREVPVSDRRSKTLVKLIDGSCLFPSVSALQFSSELFRRSLIEALYSTDFGKTSPELPLQQIKIDYRSERDFSDNQDSETFVTIRQLGDCTVRQDPLLVHQYLSYRIYSAQEESLIPRLQGAMAACMEPGSMSLKFSRATMRGVLAEAIYRIRSSARAVIAG